MTASDYKCNDCDSRFAFLQPIGESENTAKCPDCGSENIEQVTSQPEEAKETIETILRSCFT